MRNYNILNWRGAEMPIDKFEIRAIFKKDEMDDIVNLNGMKIKIGPRGLVLLGVLRYLEYLEKKTKDETVKRECQTRIDKLKQILGII